MSNTVVNALYYWMNSLNSYGPVAKPRKKKSSVKGYPTILACYPTGSRYICDPPVMDTDVDTFVLVQEFPDEDEMNKLGWELTKNNNGSAYDGGMFQSYRQGEKNLILMESRQWYLRSVAATLLAKELNLTNKADRVAIHGSLQMGEHYDGPLPNKGFL